MPTNRHGDFEASAFQDKPAYRYIRREDALPSTDAAHAAGDEALVKVKLFDPSGCFTWYVAGYDPSTRVAWGLVYGYELESGDFSMAELSGLRTRLRLPIERDLYFEPITISEIRRRLRIGEQV